MSAATVHVDFERSIVISTDLMPQTANRHLLKRRRGGHPIGPASPRHWRPTSRVALIRRGGAIWKCTVSTLCVLRLHASVWAPRSVYVYEWRASYTGAIIHQSSSGFAPVYVAETTLNWCMMLAFAFAMIVILAIRLLQLRVWLPLSSLCRYTHHKRLGVCQKDQRSPAAAFSPDNLMRIVQQSLDMYRRLVVRQVRSTMSVHSSPNNNASHVHPSVLWMQTLKSCLMSPKQPQAQR